MLRETLAVLLERDCRLEFLNPGAAGPVAALSPDLAILATPTPARLLHDLTRHCPTLPIVSVELASTTAPAGTPGLPVGVTCVPLEPHAIRSAVMERLACGPDPELHATVRAIADALHAEVAQSLAALRTCARHLAKAGTAAGTTLVDLVREHGAVVGAALDDLQRFQARPRQHQPAADFAAAVCRELAQHDATAETRLVCGCKIDASIPLPPGPVALAPVVGAFLHAYLRRRVGAPVVRVAANDRGVRLWYPAPPASGPASALLPLRLAGLTLPSWRWSLSMSSSEDLEMILLSPTTST